MFSFVLISSMDMRRIGAPGLPMVTPACFNMASAPDRAHAATSEDAVTGTAVAALSLMKRLPSVLSGRASATCASAIAAHGGNPGKSPGGASVLYDSGTANGPVDEGVAQPAATHKTTTARVEEEVWKCIGLAMLLSLTNQRQAGIQMMPGSSALLPNEFVKEA
jgi:hypothetical protein